MIEKKDYKSPEMLLEDISLNDAILTSGVKDFDETSREVWDF